MRRGCQELLEDIVMGKAAPKLSKTWAPAVQGDASNRPGQSRLARGCTFSHMNLLLPCSLRLILYSIQLLALHELRMCSSWEATASVNDTSQARASTWSGVGAEVAKLALPKFNLFGD
jgi:hypothetical protein